MEFFTGILTITFICFLLAHWFVLARVFCKKNDSQALKAVCFSLFCVEVVFVVGNLVFRTL